MLRWKVNFRVGEYLFPQLQSCTADCTEGSCLSTTVIFNSFLVFNFPFFNFEQ